MPASSCSAKTSSWSVAALCSASTSSDIDIVGSFCWTVARSFCCRSRFSSFIWPLKPQSTSAQHDKKQTQQCSIRSLQTVHCFEPCNRHLAKHHQLITKWGKWYNEVSGLLAGITQRKQLCNFVAFSCFFSDFLGDYGAAACTVLCVCCCMQGDYYQHSSLVYYLCQW